ncbi:MAG: SUMF1/EgtB/PvdO family nonheme iron enzyme [Cyanobacteria bacterium P01_D01_bin.156]
MSKIFISYRREDSKNECGRIYDRLLPVFGKKRIFKDVDSIRHGDVFPKAIKDAISESTVLLALIGKEWLNAEDADGNRRLDNPKDWVRKELEFAIKDKRDITIIPLLLDSAVSIPKAAELPKSLQGLSVINGIWIRPDPDFNNDMEKLIGVLKEILFESRREFIKKLTKTTFVGTGILALSGISLSLNKSKKPNVVIPSFIPHLGAHSKERDIEFVAVNSSGMITTRYQKRVPIFTEKLGSSVKLGLTYLPKGHFLMGTSKHEEGHRKKEDPQHQVDIAKSFWMGKYLVTQRQWKTIAKLPKVNTALNPEPSHFKGDERPVEGVSWHEAIEFCNRLTKKTGRLYRLPSESEWEYACRSNTDTAFSVGSTITPALANYNGGFTYGKGPKEIYRKKTSSVGLFPPNAFGLYDMHGNLWEWCLDYGHFDYKGAPTDGSPWIRDGDVTKRTARGGSWISHPKDCRAAARAMYGATARSRYIGFRVVCSDEHIV